MARNRYQDRCYVCGLPVLAGTGHFQREGNGWLTKHALHPGDGRVTCEMAKETECETRPLENTDGIGRSMGVAAMTESHSVAVTPTPSTLHR